MRNDNNCNSRRAYEPVSVSPCDDDQHNISMSCRTDTASPDCTIDVVSDILKCDASIIIDKLSSHLSVDQRADILAVIDDFAVCFSSQPGLYTGIEHCRSIVSK